MIKTRRGFQEKHTLSEMTSLMCEIYIFACKLNTNISIFVQGQLCTKCKNRAPHVNFCHPVVLKSYGSKVSKKIGWHFFKPGSRSFQGHIISNV